MRPSVSVSGISSGTADVILFISHVGRSCQAIDNVRIPIKMQINNKQKWFDIYPLGCDQINFQLAVRGHVKTK